MDVGRSSLKITVARVASLLLSFAGIAFFARELGASRLGVFFLFQASLKILALPANVGIGIAVEKRISEGTNDRRVLGSAIVMKSISLSAVVAGILYFQAELNEYLGADLAVLLVVAIVIQQFAGLFVNVLKGELRVGETAILQLAYAVVWISVGVTLVAVDYGVVGLVYAIIVGTAVKLVWAFAKITVEIGRPTATQARSLYEYAKYSIVPEIDGQVHSWMDVLIIGFFLTQASVAAYEVAWRVAGPVLLLTTAISNTIFPQISSWESDDSIESLERLLPRIITPSMLFVFPAFFGGALLSREILVLVFGEGFAAGWVALIVLLAGKLPRAVRKIVGKSLLGLNRPDLVTRAALVDIVANFALNVVLISQLGIVGAAFGTTLSMTLGTVHRVHYLSEYVEIRVPYRELSWCLLSSVGMFFVLYAAKTVVELTTLFRLLAFIAAGAVLYGLFILSYDPLRTKFVRQLGQFTT